MAKFRMNHAQKGRGSTGYLIRIAAAAFLFFGFLFFLLYFFRTNDLPLSGKYGTDPSERFFLPESDNYTLFHYPLFSVAYHPERNLAVWGAYELDESLISGEATRRRNWRREEGLADLPTIESLQQWGLTTAQLVPARDVGNYKPARKATYRSSNYCLQKPGFHQHAWLPLEDQIRSWSRQTGFLYIVSGVVDDPALLNQKGAFFVPEYLYKVVLDLSVQDARGLAVVLKQSDARLELQDQILTIDSLETLTGLDFFPGLMTDSLEQLVEQGVDLACWE